MDAAVRQVIAALHQSPRRYVLALTGGGATAVGWLLAVPGGSRTVLEAAVPYDERALAEYLARRPESFCSAATARDLAVRACERARWLAPGAAVLGLGCTASLRSDRPKKGDHRCHIAVCDGVRTTTHSLYLRKDARSREDEEDVTARVLLNLLAEGLGVTERPSIPLLTGETIEVRTTVEGEAWGRFMAGDLRTLYVESDGRMRLDAPAPAVLLPGSFNPLHEGHLRLARVAAEIVGAPAAFDLSVQNADKPPLTSVAVRRRLTQFTWRAPVWLTRAPKYTEKAELFPGCIFVVGADTAARIVQPRFYQDSAERMAEALAGIRAHGCRFLTAGRVDRDGRFLGLDDLAIPTAFRDLFTGVPEAAFRMDLSSTELRAAGGGSGLQS